MCKYCELEEKIDKLSIQLDVLSSLLSLAINRNNEAKAIECVRKIISIRIEAESLKDDQLDFIQSRQIH